jgi:hypothetical protein
MVVILPWQKLAKKNAHPRDARIVFDEPTHTYYIDGCSEGIVSCTKFLHSFFPHFDPVATVKKMMASPKWPQNKLFGMTADQIIKKWNDSGKEASGLGTKLHLAIEMFLNGVAEADLDREVVATVEWRYFKNFWRDVGEDIEPYRLEWEVYVDELRLAGQIDGLFRRKSDGAFLIYDWKRSREIKSDNPFGTGFPPVEHLPDTNYWHYSLQLNVYRWILEHYYDMKISDMYLVILHPDNKNYRRLRLNFLDEEVEEMMEARRRAVAAGGKDIAVLPLPSEERCAIRL